LLLTLGYADLPMSVSVYGASDGERIVEPVPGVLLQCDGGWLLLDTGYNVSLINDPALRRRFYPDPHVRPVLQGPGEPLEEVLDKAGVDIGDVHAVAVSHLHLDHAGGLKADLTENIEQELPVGTTIGVQPSATVEPIRRLKRIAAERGYPLVPGHDPVAWPKLTQELAARWPDRP